VRKPAPQSAFLVNQFQVTVAPFSLTTDFHILIHARMAKSRTVQQIRPPRRSFSDPFEAVLLPPANETQEQREQRLNAEYAAKLVSDNIDQMIANERNAKKKAKAEIKVLLLGQSESGKSTTLKRERAIYVLDHRIWVTLEGLVHGLLLWLRLTATAVLGALSV
jgi:hypothetical protein